LELEKALKEQALEAQALEGETDIFKYCKQLEKQIKNLSTS